jgi:hypothetical protein
MNGLEDDLDFDDSNEEKEEDDVSDVEVLIQVHGIRTCQTS